MPGQTTGKIALVNGNAYGIIFDGMESMGVHKWYVGEELELAASSSKPMKKPELIPAWKYERREKRQN